MFTDFFNVFALNRMKSYYSYNNNDLYRLLRLILITYFLLDEFYEINWIFLRKICLNSVWKCVKLKFTQFSNKSTTMVIIKTWTNWIYMFCISDLDRSLLTIFFLFFLVYQMIHNSMSWCHRLRWLSSMASIRNEFIKAAVDRILWRIHLGYVSSIRRLIEWKYVAISSVETAPYETHILVDKEKWMNQVNRFQWVNEIKRDSLSNQFALYAHQNINCYVKNW